MNAVFLYGSLLDQKLRDAVFADSLDNTEIVTATAHHFCTYRYPGEAFPVLLPAQGSRANGAVLINPSEEAIERMAFYEGDEYEIATVNVTLECGTTLPAHYNRALELEGLEFSEPWCLDTWRKQESAVLVEIARRYMERCWGFMNATEADVIWRELQYLRDPQS